MNTQSLIHRHLKDAPADPAIDMGVRERERESQQAFFNLHAQGIKKQLTVPKGKITLELNKLLNHSVQVVRGEF